MREARRPGPRSGPAADGSPRQDEAASAVRRKTPPERVVLRIGPTTRDGHNVFEVRKRTRDRAIRRSLTATTATDGDPRATRVPRQPRRWRADGRARGCVELSSCATSGSSGRQAPPPASPSARSSCTASDSTTTSSPPSAARTKAAAVTVTRLRTLIDRLRARGLAGSTVHGSLVATSSLLRFAVRRGHLNNNPVRLLERGDRPSTKRRKEPRYLNRTEIDRLLDQLRTEPRAIAATLAYAGLRISEALTLCWHDVDLETGELHITGTKTAAWRDQLRSRAHARAMRWGRRRQRIGRRKLVTTRGVSLPLGRSDGRGARPRGRIFGHLTGGGGGTSRRWRQWPASAGRAPFARVRQAASSSPRDTSA